MKRKIKLILFFAVLSMLVFSLTAFATEVASGKEIKIYIEERIIPVLMGVATSIIALLGTLKGVFNALKGLKESKASFDEAQRKIEKNSRAELEAIKEKYEEIKSSIKDVPQLEGYLKELRGQAGTLAVEIANLSEIVSLGFQESKELVKDGKAREIVLLANKNQEMIENEAI